MHVKSKDLPPTLRQALASLGFCGVDVNLRAQDTYTMSAGGSGEGRRAFVCAVNLATGERETKRGSWGGPNPFNPGNAVDLDRESRPLPPNFAVIYGSEGGGVRVSHVDLNPQTLQPLLPDRREIPEVDAAVLEMYAGLTSAGRKNHVERWVGDAGRAADPKYQDRTARTIAEGVCKKLVEEATDRLVASGLLARNKAGAISVTTEGRNARGEFGKRAKFDRWGWYPGKAPEEPAAIEDGKTGREG